MAFNLQTVAAHAQRLSPGYYNPELSADWSMWVAAAEQFNWSSEVLVAIGQHGSDYAVASNYALPASTIVTVETGVYEVRITLVVGITSVTGAASQMVNTVGWIAGGVAQTHPSAGLSLLAPGYLAETFQITPDLGTAITEFPTVTGLTGGSAAFTDRIQVIKIS